MRLVERGANEVVHRRIGNHKSLLAVLLHLQHACQQRARLRHEEPSRLEQQSAFKSIQRLLDRRCIFLHLRRRTGTRVRRGVIIDAETAARIDHLDARCRRA